MNNIIEKDKQEKKNIDGLLSLIEPIDNSISKETDLLESISNNTKLPKDLLEPTEIKPFSSKVTN